jgi:murein DD-endopeptidase MepM/ murein hydrolase activator NlpD
MTADNGTMRWSWLLPFLLVVPGLTPASAAPRQEDDLTISSAVQLVQPGSVVLMIVACREPPDRVVASAFGKEMVFYPDPDGKTWRGLVGVDVESRPGAYVLLVRAIRDGRPELAATHQLRVAPRRFPTRRLNVATRYASPPATALERIRQESERLGEIFQSVTPHRWSGPFLLPVGDDPTSNFGARSIFNGQSRNPHAGIDFRSREGTPVRAPNAGLIVLAENLFFTGNTVVVDHGLGLYSLFAHLSRIDVARGAAVESGATLGLVGATGRVTGPHLHWAVRLNEARVDPLSLVAAFATQAAAGRAK